MELKHLEANSHNAVVIWLLIVPYGIETRYKDRTFLWAAGLLIVPYGIETQQSGRISGRIGSLLIVPYGIETRIGAPCLHLCMRLLIVPYGIETGSRPPSLHWAGAFNRTLWNWNRVAFGATGPATMTFNRTLWNWNCVADVVQSGLQLLLIVPYGIETSKGLSVKDLLSPFNRTLWNWNKILKPKHKLSSAFNRTLWNWNLHTYTIKALSYGNF